MEEMCLRPENEILELAKLIEEATQVGDSATAFSAQRLAVCVQVGERLREWKKVIPRGEWGRWLEAHFPDFEERSGQRWMRLAEAKLGGRLNVETARGLRHAYQLAGLLPDADSSNTKGSSKPTTYTVHVARLVAALQHISLGELTERERNDLRVRLQPVVEFLQKL
jgi:hypothetical protein